MGKFKTQVIINCKFLFNNHMCFIVNSTWDKILYITIKSKINLYTVVKQYLTISMIEPYTPGYP